MHTFSSSNIKDSSSIFCTDLRAGSTCALEWDMLTRCCVPMLRMVVEYIRLAFDGDE